ncbi:hypothetical protein BDR03DRAFT_973179 [Suillus americanus]|nr:hypothetical protein BDR03DRAFT_973179 [Suillus americanus]
MVDLRQYWSELLIWCLYVFGGCMYPSLTLIAPRQATILLEQHALQGKPKAKLLWRDAAALSIFLCPFHSQSQPSNDATPHTSSSKRKEKKVNCQAAQAKSNFNVQQSAVCMLYRALKPRSDYQQVEDSI